MGKVWDTFKKAKKSLIIATPYFVPSKEMVKELKAALNRGVNVKILVPFKSDAILLKQAAYPYLKDMLHAGAEIYQYRNGFFHGKVTIIDGEIVDIGTANFDNRSFYLNCESNCIIYDKTVVDEVWSRLQVDFHKSKRFSEEDLRKLVDGIGFSKNSECFSIIFIAYGQKRREAL